MTSIRHLCLNLFQQESSSLSLAKKREKPREAMLTALKLYFQVLFNAVALTLIPTRRYFKALWRRDYRQLANPLSLELQPLHNPLQETQRQANSLQSDDYAGYDAICIDKGIIHLGCWNHARRKYVEAEKAQPKQKHKKRPPSKATVALSLINKLYRIERGIKLNSLTCKYLCND